MNTCAALTLAVLGVQDQPRMFIRNDVSLFDLIESVEADLIDCPMAQRPRW